MLSCKEIINENVLKFKSNKNHKHNQCKSIEFTVLGTQGIKNPRRKLLRKSTTLEHPTVYNELELTRHYLGIPT